MRNLLNIFQAFSGWTGEQMKVNFAGMRYGDLKKAVTDMVVSRLEPIQKNYEELTADRGTIRQILKEGAERVAPIAQQTMDLRPGAYRPLSWLSNSTLMCRWSLQGRTSK